MLPVSFDDNPSIGQSAAVAIDKDKNSMHAVQWTVDNLIRENGTLTLIHVRVRHRRRIRNPDVPSCITKSAPDFCAVYVITRQGKAGTVKSATRPPPHPAIPSPKATPTGHPPHSPHGFPEDVTKTPARGSWHGGRQGERTNDYVRMTSREKSAVARSSISSLSDNFEQALFAPRMSNAHDVASVLDDPDFSGSSGSSYKPWDFSTLDPQDFSTASSTSSSSSHSSVEAEIRRLKLELEQTMQMYSSACKEAITAKQKAAELAQWKLDEARRFEEAKHEEDAALRVALMEKAKYKAALQDAQRLAEEEARKRWAAENKVQQDAEERYQRLGSVDRTELMYRKYTIEEIAAATDKFSKSLKIGEGGYGPVYSAILHHTPVAIKILRPDTAQGMRQFKQEIEVLSCIRHPNMVLLLGACPEYGCLVYEYMDNGSLDDRLFRRGNTPSIPWQIRFKIAAEIATGLLFLHQTKPEPLVHRDLKPGNILLDQNYVSKIADVGLARLVPAPVADSVTQYHMTSAAGTFCYIDPEYQQTGMLGTKSDIYSLGIMLLQIITAKPPMGLAHHIEKAINKGTFAEVLDSSIQDWPLEEVLSYAKLALRCAELRRKDRPDLGSVILPELNRLRDFGASKAGGAYDLYHVLRTHSRNQQSRFADVSKFD
ncbi:hypothetical protein Sjap_011738 [Stephania japonica]|uniref:Protein kinase domain-containing protein n=1 Tax=Stephania japonica TaxID=461633 RepID=A0AAP0JDP5_9MAGN